MFKGGCLKIRNPDQGGFNFYQETESGIRLLTYIATSVVGITMNARRALTLLFGMILLAMLAVTGWASWVQPVWQWTGLKQQPNHAWTIATLFDAYFGFITFYMWVIYKERSAVKRVVWFVTIMGLGNMAMSIYMLKELRKLAGEDELVQLLVRRNG